MKKKKVKKLLFFVFAVVLLFCTFCISVSAADSDVQSLNKPDAFTIKELSIVTNHAILEGQTLQMQVEEFEEFVLLGFVEWSSSNPDVISCSKSGEIKGLKEGKATIKVKAKVGNASDSITVYCARRLKEAKSSRIKNSIAWTTNSPFLLDFQTFHFNVFPIWLTEKLEVKGVYGSFFYVEFEREEKQFKGFIPRIWMPDDLASNEIFSQLSVYDLDVYVGLDRPHYVLTTSYEGEVKWNVSDNTIIDFNDETGKIRTLKPGIATISATVGNKTLVCTIHSIYHWPLEWTGAAIKATCVYKAVGNTYEETETPLAVGDKFTVKADAGGDSEWAYGANENGVFGYVPISHISTKGTISQYNAMNYRWPVNDTNIKKISSPFGPRSTSNGGNHKGFDIVSEKSGAIEGKSVVSTYKGTIKKIYIDNDKSTSHGNAIVITTDKIDPISGKNLTAIYMHLSRWNTNSSGNIVVDGKELKEGDSVTMGQLIGCAGNTGYNTFAAHLHYEVNNQNAAIRSGSNNPFTETINPIYFYMDMDNSITKSDICEAASNGNGFYWYGEDK